MQCCGKYSKLNYQFLIHSNTKKEQIGVHVYKHFQIHGSFLSTTHPKVEGGEVKLICLKNQLTGKWKVPIRSSDYSQVLTQEEFRKLRGASNSAPIMIGFRIRDKNRYINVCEYKQKNSGKHNHCMITFFKNQPSAMKKKEISDNIHFQSDHNYSSYTEEKQLLTREIDSVVGKT